MSKTIILVAMCDRTGQTSALFNVKAMLEGKKITMASLDCKPEQMPTEGQSYLMYIEVEGIAHGILRGKILKINELIGDL